MEPKVIFEDNEILVLDKPAGMIVNKSDTTVGEVTVQDWVQKYFKIPNSKSQISNKSKIQNANVQNDLEFRDSKLAFLNRAGIVHRLDKETSGILLVAKTPEAFENLQKQFKERKVKKTYVALVHGKVEPSEGEINVPVGRLPWNRKRFGVLAAGREAMTKYKVLRNVISTSLKTHQSLNDLRSKATKDLTSFEILRFAQNDKGVHLTLLELYPETGRTHQIRVHLQYINHPIFSDHLYAGRKTSRNDRKFLSRFFLHASKISFFHPKTNQLVSFESALPEELNQFLKTLNSE